MASVKYFLIGFLVCCTLGHALIPVPMTRQSTNYSCGAAIALSLLGYYGDQCLETDLFMPLETNNDYGTDREELVSFFKSKDYQVCARDKMTLCDLKNDLSRNLPVICLIQAWQNDVKDYTDYWDIGHYVIVIGMDDNSVYVMDPWILGNYGFIPLKDFESRWHQLTKDKERLEHWGMTVSKGTPSFKPCTFVQVP